MLRRHGLPVLLVYAACCLVACGDATIDGSLPEGVVPTSPQREAVPNTEVLPDSEVVSVMEWVTYSPEAVAALRKEGRPVLIDFYATWDPIVMRNRKLLVTEEANELYERYDVALIKGDFTESDPAIAEVLRDYDSLGVPFHMVYPARGDDPEVLPQALSLKILEGAIKRAAGDSDFDMAVASDFDLESPSEDGRVRLSGLSFVLPEDWSIVPSTSEFRLFTLVPPASFSGAQVTIGRFNGDVGGFAANIDRWMKEIGMQQPTGGRTDWPQITVGDTQAAYLPLVNKETGKTTLAIWVPRGDNPDQPTETWTFKLTCTAKQALELEAPFQRWAESVVFE